MQNQPKQVWETPKVVRHGSVAVMTQQNVNGNYLDQSFPEGTPFSDLTFS
jgi:hypothetical protein